MGLLIIISNIQIRNGLGFVEHAARTRVRCSRLHGVPQVLRSARIEHLGRDGWHDAKRDDSAICEHFRVNNLIQIKYNLINFLLKSGIRLTSISGRAVCPKSRCPVPCWDPLSPASSPPSSATFDAAIASGTSYPINRPRSRPNSCRSCARPSCPD